MARPLRIEYSGAVYHITSRGNEKKAIFRDDRDRQIFLGIHLILFVPRGKLNSVVSQIRRVGMKSLVRISSKGQLVIPKAIRDKLKLTPKKPVIVQLKDDHVVVKAIPDLRKTLRGSLKGKPSMSQALIREHQSEVTHDEKLSV